MFVLIDAWLLLFSKKVLFMADLQKKYICRSAVALVETHSFGVPFRSFSILWCIWSRSSSRYEGIPPEELWRNSVYSGNLLSYREELRDHMHHQMENERKGTPKECVSTSATADLHMYFFCRSAIKITFVLNKNNHASMSTNIARY